MEWKLMIKRSGTVKNLNNLTMFDQLDSNMSTTIKEKIIVGLNAIIGGIGTTVGIIAGSFWLLTMSVKAVGLGSALYGSAAAGIISGVGIICGIFAIPIAYVYFKDLIEEAKNLNKTINNEIKLYQENLDKLLHRLIQLRSLFLLEIDFIKHIKKFYLSDDIIIDKGKIISLTNYIYNFLGIGSSLIERPSPVKVATNDKIKKTPSSINTLSNTNYVTHEKTPSKLPELDQLNTNLVNCFKPILKLSTKKRFKAITYGFITCFAISGSILGTGAAFAGLIAGAGLCATIPVVGWAILGIASIAVGVSLGIGIAFYKKKKFYTC